MAFAVSVGMSRYFQIAIAGCFLSVSGSMWAQSPPPSPGAVWHDAAEQKLKHELSSLPQMKYPTDANKTYTLAELVDVAEQHNPETRVAWQRAKERAAALGVARSALFPTVAAVAVANTTRTRILFNSAFFRQTYGVFSPNVHMEYLVLDFGERSGAIDEAKAHLLAADMAFNDVHRKIIFETMASYYRLLNAIGQRGAAEVSLKNAQAVQEDAQDRLNHGLGTKPDALEAQAVTAQAEYDLQAAIGAEEISRGDLMTILGLPPDTRLQVEDITRLNLPGELAENVDAAIERAFEQRPDLKAQLANLRVEDAAMKRARSAYFPSLSFSGDGGATRQYGRQELLAPAYVGGETWNVSLALKWTLFDGTRREHEVAETKAARLATQAEIDSLRDQIANEVWAAYSNMKTAQRQQQAAAALLVAADESYASAHESYSYGVRNLLDVVAAQKALAVARSEDVSARTQLLLQTANLAFETGDLISAPPRKVGP